MFSRLQAETLHLIVSLGFTVARLSGAKFWVDVIVIDPEKRKVFFSGISAKINKSIIIGKLLN